jgi:hypothetical protein
MIALQYKISKKHNTVRVELFSTFSNSYRIEYFYFNVVDKGVRKRIPKTQVANVDEILDHFMPGLALRWKKTNAKTILEEFDELSSPFGKYFEVNNQPDIST